MITIEMLTAAIYSYAGLAVLVVALTQILKNVFKTSEIEKPGKKKCINHLLSFVTSIVCCFVVLFFGTYYNMGIFSEFCLKCLDSWALFVGTVIATTGMANGIWTYDIMEKILQFVKLIPKKN